MLRCHIQRFFSLSLFLFWLWWLVFGWKHQPSICIAACNAYGKCEQVDIRGINNIVILSMNMKQKKNGAQDYEKNFTSSTNWMKSQIFRWWFNVLASAIFAFTQILMIRQKKKNIKKPIRWISQMNKISDEKTNI